MKKLIAVLCLLVSVLSLNAQDAKKLKDAGYEALKQKNLSVALENFEKAYAADTEFMSEQNNTLYNMGTCAYKLKKYNKAIKYFNLCFEKGYKGEKSCRYISFCYKKMKDSDNYLATLNKGFEKYPNSLAIKKSLSKYYLLEANGVFAKGTKVLTQANAKVEKKTFDTNSDQYKAAQKEAHGFYAEALPVCEKALVIYPDYAQAKQLKVNIEKSLEQTAVK
ncbi:hypothetical protein K5X82_04215 [Halosquirtibacter xylanolyticus]|uniref:tetratricopeptide repeat protein n=1 Tax=Halosquirtibacter xylanolyticus TaxID=3374599 RepID=UPI0037481F45|nr:hypothetical protein K5X82_04215 [Prolixibacteraceae bacterium]